MGATGDADTVRAGLLMEAAQAQQQAAESSLRRLQEHTVGLDALIRDQIRQALIDEFAALGGEVASAAATVRELRHGAPRRLAAWGALITICAGLVITLGQWWWLPSRAELTQLQERREQLRTALAQLQAQGAAIELRRCGEHSRLCVRIDRSAPPYGAQADYRILWGE